MIILMFLLQQLMLYLLPIFFIYNIYKHNKRLLWIVPLVVGLVIGLSLFAEITSFHQNEPFKEQIRLYFVNDSSMTYHLLYKPILISSFASTIFFYLYSLYLFIKNKRKTNTEDCKIKKKKD